MNNQNTFLLFVFRSRLLLLLIAMFCSANVNVFSIWAQEKKSTPESVKDLELQQKQLAQRFGNLEELFIRMSELEAANNPTRAGLLLQAAKMSKQLATLQRLSVAGDLLSQGQFTRAIQEQVSSQENLRKLLELLQSENRSTRLKDERTRLLEIQQEIRRLEQIQRGQTARTESGQDMKQAATDQKDIKEQLEKVASDLKSQDEDKDKQKNKNESPNGNSNEASKDSLKNASEKKNEDPNINEPKNTEDGQPKDGQPKDGQPKDGQPKDGQPKDGQPKDGQPKDGQPKDGQPKDGQPKDGQPKDGQPKDGQPKDGQPKDGQPKDEDSQSKESDTGESQKPNQSSKKKEQQKPESKEDKAKKRVESARKRMQNAQEKLEEKNRDEAVEEQREAERELREAIDELERILRQLREEEIERSLVDVETRLRKMLDLQRVVREQTEKLGNLTGDAKDLTLEIQANKLSIEQSKIVMEGQRALLLLQDEGSSTAFPEALEQVNADAQSVSKKLTEANVSSLTLSIEDEIIGALEEMLDSLKQVQKKREDKKKQQLDQQQQQSNNPEDEPLVDSIAELKLLKTLQLRINRRTQALAKQTNNQEDVIGQVGDPGLLGELEDLAERQQKIHEVTRDILLKAAKD